MRPSLVRAVLCSCLVLAAGCGEETSKDLKEAGAKAADKAKDAGAAMNKQLEDAVAALDKLATEATAAMKQKGNELATLLKSKQPDIDKLVDATKAQLSAKGAAVKDMAADLTTRNEKLKSAVASLEKAGANASEEVKQAAVDAFNAVSNGLKAAMNKLKS